MAAIKPFSFSFCSSCFGGTGAFAGTGFPFLPALSFASGGVRTGLPVWVPGGPDVAGGVVVPEEVTVPGAAGLPFVAGLLWAGGLAIVTDLSATNVSAMFSCRRRLL